MRSAAVCVGVLRGQSQNRRGGLISAGAVTHLRRILRRRCRIGCEPEPNTPARSDHRAEHRPSSSQRNHRRLPRDPWNVLLEILNARIDGRLLLSAGPGRGKRKGSQTHQDDNRARDDYASIHWFEPPSVALWSVTRKRPPLPEQLFNYSFYRPGSPLRTASHWIPIEAGDKTVWSGCVSRAKSLVRHRQRSGRQAGLLLTEASTPGFTPRPGQARDRPPCLELTGTSLTAGIGRVTSVCRRSTDPSPEHDGYQPGQPARPKPTMHVIQRPGEAALFGRYHLAPYDEMFASSDAPRPHYASLFEQLIELGPEELERRNKLADLTMRQQGITFTVYGRKQGVERIIPFDPIPRLIAAAEWDRIERGLKQRVRALNLFIHDVYHDRLILKDRIVPPELVFGATGYRRDCVGLQVPQQHLHSRRRHRLDPRLRWPLSSCSKTTDALPPASATCSRTAR